MGSSALICMGQFAPDVNKPNNIDIIRDLTQQAKQGGADMIVLPEDSMVSGPKLSLEEKQRYCEPLDGTFANALRQMARDHGITMIAGMQEKVDDTRPANTMLYITPDGDIGGCYRKLHLYDAFGYKESDTVKPGMDFEPVVFSLQGVKFGVMTCYDVRFPEMARMLVDAGADVLLVPAAWFAGSLKELHWETLLRARAIENTTYVVGVGQTRPVCTGCSMTIDPMGVVIANAGERPGVAFAQVNTTRIGEVREVNPSLINRRFSVTPKT